MVLALICTEFLCSVPHRASNNMSFMAFFANSSCVASKHFSSCAHVFAWLRYRSSGSVNRAFANDRSSAFSASVTGLRFLPRDADGLEDDCFCGMVSGRVIAGSDPSHFSLSLSLVPSSESSPSWNRIKKIN